MRNSIFLLAVFVAACSSPDYWNSRATKLTEQLDVWHDDSSGLWETTSWWNAANILTASIEHASIVGDESYAAQIEAIFNKTKEFEVPASNEKQAWICSNYINDYYDDEAWWALAWLDAFEFTGNQAYFEMSEIIFADIVSGWSALGGLYWKKGVQSRNSISNGLTLSLATRLHMNGSNQEFNGMSPLKWAVTIWDWMVDTGLINEKGLIQDGVRRKGEVDVVNKNVWTYNQGVVLTGLVNLSILKNDSKYLEAAHDIAEAAIEHFSDDLGILTEIRCEPDDCNGDAKQFKGVFMRHLSYLNQSDPKEEYEAFIIENCNSIWTHAMDSGVMMPGVDWNGKSDANGATVSSALDAFNAIMNLKKY